MQPRQHQQSASTGYFVTGTDTGVGKTTVACALLHAFAATGRRVVGMKPVAAGVMTTSSGLINDDVIALCAAANVEAPLELINPYCFEPAIAPHIAADLAGITISLAVIESAYSRLAAMADTVIVEGAGGFAVPLNANEDSRHLARRLNLPMILVVGVRLGCLNHALLTADAICATGLHLAGWVANRIDPDMEQVERNIDTLTQRLNAPQIADMRFCSTQPLARDLAAGFNLHQLSAAVL